MIFVCTIKMPNNTVRAPADGKHSKVPSSGPLPLGHIQHEGTSPSPPSTTGHIQHKGGSPKPPPAIGHIQHGGTSPSPPSTIGHIQHKGGSPKPPPAIGHIQHGGTSPSPPSTTGHIQHKGGSPKPPPAIGHIQHEHSSPSPGSLPDGKIVQKNCTDLNLITQKYDGKASECCRDPDSEGLCASGCTMSDKSTGVHCVPLSEAKYDKGASAGCFKVVNGTCIPLSNDPTCGVRHPDSLQSKLTLNECRSGMCYPDTTTCRDAVAESAPDQKKNTAGKLPTTLLDKLLENNGLKRACTRDSSTLAAAMATLEDLLKHKLGDYEKFMIETLVCGFAMAPPSNDVLSKFPYSGQGPGKNPGLFSLIRSGKLQCYPQLNNHGKCSSSSRYYVSGINAPKDVLRLISMFLTSDGVKSTVVSGGELPLPFQRDFMNVQSKFIDGTKLTPEEKRVYRQAILNYLLGMAYPCSVDEDVRKLGDSFVTNLTVAMTPAPPAAKKKKLADVQVKAPTVVKPTVHSFNWNLFGVITGISVVFILIVVGFIVVHKSRNK